jgi:hypothetical protein
MDNVDTRAHADAARVGISDDRVRPYILIGGTASNPVLRPVLDSGDPIVDSQIKISAGRSGVTLSGDVKKYHTFFGAFPYEELCNQVLVRPRHDRWPIGGDSGSPLWSPMSRAGISGAKIHGLYIGTHQAVV